MQSNRQTSQAASNGSGSESERVRVSTTLRGESGDSLVEFAVAAIVLFSSIFGIMDCARALYAYHFVCYAAREAARYATVRGATWASTSCASTTAFKCSASAANIQSYVQAIAPWGIDSGTPLTVTATWPGTTPSGATGTCPTTSGNNSAGCVVKVQVSFSFNYVSPLLPQAALLLTSTSEMVISQ